MQAEVRTISLQSMNVPSFETALSRCPFLGLSWDSDSTSLLPTKEHRCFARKEREVSLFKQSEVCLGEEYEGCRTYAFAAANRAINPQTERQWFAYGVAFLIPVATFIAAAALRVAGLV